MKSLVLYGPKREFMIKFYDLTTNRTFLPPIVELRGVNESVETIDAVDGFRVETDTNGVPCTCNEWTCGCCAGIKVDQFNYDHKCKLIFYKDIYSESTLLKVY